MDSLQASSSAASAGPSPWEEDARQIQRRRSVAVMKGGRDLRFATEESRASKVASDIVGQAHHIIFYSKAPSGRPALLPIRRQDEFEHQEEENEKKLSLQEYRKDTRLDVCKPKRMAKSKRVQAVEESHPIIDLIILAGFFTVNIFMCSWAYSAFMHFA